MQTETQSYSLEKTDPATTRNELGRCSPQGFQGRALVSQYLSTAAVRFNPAHLCFGPTEPRGEKEVAGVQLGQTLQQVLTHVTAIRPRFHSDPSQGLKFMDFPLSWLSLAAKKDN